MIRIRAGLWVFFSYPFHIYWCIRKPWSSSIILYNKSSITHNHHTNNNPYIYQPINRPTPKSTDTDTDTDTTDTDTTDTDTTDTDATDTDTVTGTTG